ncbi:MG2 domain-containing protein [Sulfuricurvum sp.]|uniref:MG2 domain-containing protein n=1 Tax=Sulfuricurvum sp. TaxID=2025608 RepID=UPI002E354CE1|nr:MG2 domain-containing protein [Sulfuricurvum sp.]HEX5330121.1 MG2 domain-containing protein [Sulfuricurvum sp.]
MKSTRFITKLLLLLVFAIFNGYGDEEDYDGSPFFLLSDSTFSTTQQSSVRFEAESMSSVYEYGGVDVYVYKVKDPLGFLQAQKNLHRINTAPNYSGWSIANALALVWDKLWQESRELWRKIFTKEVRNIVTKNVPEVRAHPLSKAPTPKVYNPKYKPLTNHTLVESFRYPVHQANPIQPPEGVKLAGSSSNFIRVHEGNVLIPLGKRAPGLYLVEAMVGDHRATTLMFVSDSVAITKISNAQLLTWVVNRKTSEPVEDVKTIWSDGIGTLGDGESDENGLVSFERQSPEKSYVFGKDTEGGVFISENYYYDSEIYNAKLYAITDRPLYRPGDTVNIKFYGRQFVSARDSVALKNGKLSLQVFDPNGFPVEHKTLSLDGQTGAQTRFKLPDNASSGGYEIRFVVDGNTYTAAFRVSQYQKPHFEMTILGDKPQFKTNEPIGGKIQLTYPDGKPVVNATVDLTIRAQQLSMIEGSMGYGGEFPLKLTTATLTTDAKGVALFSAPPAKNPSRYILSALATDGAAYRVRANKELLIERGAGTYQISAVQSFSEIKTKVAFQIKSLQSASTASAKPVSVSWLRLEDRKSFSQPLTNGENFDIVFDVPGTYTVSLRDGEKNILGARTHYVSGKGIKAPQGSIQMVSDKASYVEGEKANVLVTFPEKVDQALFTLERDRVEKTALMRGKSDWIEAQRLSDTQWRVSVPIEKLYAPNITLSVVYVKGNDYVFQNCGLKVEQPKLNFKVKADKLTYAPGEKVTLDITAYNGTELSPNTPISLGVVDEMIYVLQSEIAPNMFDFFYHPRRNNVRTTASLSFIGYDLAKPPMSASFPKVNSTHQRAIKMQERPRRDDVDTAFWNPNLTSDENGHVRVTFTMPDSLTRWRITVRGMDTMGTVGQSSASIFSNKPAYIKWTSPNWLRPNDSPNASVAIFNQGTRDTTLNFIAKGTGVNYNRAITLKKGINFISLPLAASASDKKLSLSLNAEGKTLDALDVDMDIAPAFWQNKNSVSIPIVQKQTPLSLPADARNIKLQFTDGAHDNFRRIIDDLIEYPHGCVEQTSSRLIPYSLAVNSLLPEDEGLRELLTQRLHTYRFRLANMAGPNATFGWWSTPEKNGDAFLTTYAYYADWYASRTLHINMGEEHYNALLEVYRENGSIHTPFRRALMLDWMQQMGLPVHSLAQALWDDLAKQPPLSKSEDERFMIDSLIMTSENNELHHAMAKILVANVLKESGKSSVATVELSKSIERLKNTPLPLSKALLLMGHYIPVTQANEVLEEVRSQSATMDRAITMTWVYRALDNPTKKHPLTLKTPKNIVLGSAWKASRTVSGKNVYEWKGSIPTMLSVTPAKGLVAVVDYENTDNKVSTLPIQITRKLFRLSKVTPKPSGKAKTVSFDASAVQYDLIPVDAATPLDTNEVYLDQIVLNSSASSTLNFGLIEAALPPGCSADSATWGVNVRFIGSKTYVPIEKATYELSPHGYSVPVDKLKGVRVINHLIRPAQRGVFTLPPVRYYQMYQPNKKAYETDNRATITIR